MINKSIIPSIAKSTFALLSIINSSTLFASSLVNSEDYNSTSEALKALATPTLGNDSNYALTQGDDSDLVIQKYIKEGDTYTSYDFSISGTSKDSVYNEGTMSAITGTFTDKLDSVTGDFFGKTSDSSGAAIYNYGIIGTITGDFAYNTSAKSGGAIYNGIGEIESITGDFSNNITSVSGGAITNYSGEIGSISGDFVNNTATTYGGAIFSTFGEIDSISGNFIGNSAKSGGAIAIYQSYKTSPETLITGDFINNTATTSGGAIYNANSSNTYDSRIKVIGDFIGNSAKTGGAIYTASAATTTVTGSFIDNTASSLGGAIYMYMYSTVNILADTTDIEFTGNGIGTSGNISDYNAIYMGYISATYKNTLNLLAGEGKSIVFNDSIVSKNTANIVNIGSDTATGSVYFNDEVSTVTINLNGGNLIFGEDNSSVAAQVSTGYLTSSNLNIANSATLIANASYLGSNNTIVNNGTINLLGGTLSNDISGDGTIIVRDNITISSSIEASVLSIYLDTSDIASLLTRSATESIVTLENGSSISVDEISLILSDNFTAEAGSSISIFSDETNIDYTSLTIEFSDGSYLEEGDYTISSNGTIVFNTSISAVPEPSTYAMILGILALGFSYYRKRKA